MEESREFLAEGAAGTVKDLSKYVPEARRKPGELGMAVLMFLLGALGYYFTLDMTSGEYSSPSVFPKLASMVIMACSAVNFFKAVRREKPEAEATLIAQALAASNGTIAESARLLGLKRTTLVEKLKRLGLKAANEAA